MSLNSGKENDSFQVLYVSYNGLLEEIVPSQVIPYLKELVKYGYKFTLLTFEKRQDIRMHGPRGLQRHKMELADIGIDWHWLYYHKRFPLLATSFDILAGIVYTLYLAAAKKIRIVHARSVIPAVISLALRMIFGTNLVFDTRGLLAEEYAGGGHWREGGMKYRLAKFFEKACLKVADVTVVLTRRHYEYMLGLPWVRDGNSGTSIEVIPCCVDLNRFRHDPAGADLLRKKEGLQDSFIFTYLGKIGKHYMLDEMLDFFKDASGQLPNVKFMIISQNDPGDIYNAAARHNLDYGKVIIRRPSYEEIPRLISLANAGIFFINPYKKFASSPIKLGEFLSCGIPVIINSGIGDTEELVNTNKVGVAIDRFEHSDYRHALSEFLELVKEGDSLYRRCRDIAKSYLSLDSGVKKYNSVYSRALKT